MSEQQPTEILYTDDPGVRESFADSTRLTTFDGQMVHIEFTVNRPALTGVNQSSAVQVPAVRLVLTPMAALALHEQLNSLIANLHQSGILRRVEPISTTKQ